MAPIGKTVGPYRVLEKVGEGGMGVVYRAADDRLRREVALKILPEDVAGDTNRMLQFEREAQTLAALSHPNIAAIYGLEEAGPQRAIVMEFVEGTTLADRLRAGSLALDELLPLALQMTEALCAAHEKGIVHRDLKPANVKITPEGRVKILDFGLARPAEPSSEAFVSEASTRDLSDAAAGIAGTLPYMAPEQLRGDPLDERSDIYALGVVLYEMATGRRPFHDSRGPRLIGEIQHARPQSPHEIVPALPGWLVALILRCLEKEPDRRYASMRAVAEGLRSAAPAPGETAKSLAVLSFDNVGGSKEDAYLCDGITEDILVELSKVPGLRVLSRSAVAAFRDQPVAAVQIGRRLGVAFVLEGSLRRSGSRLRITAQLVDTDTSRSVWAERYDRQMEDVFAIQDEIARSIAVALRVMLSDSERGTRVKTPTTNVEAYEYYLRGRQYFREFRRKSIEFAREMIARAIEIDPNYARAYAALADCYAYLYMFWDASEANLDAADHASRRAVELDPDLAEAYVARGVAVSLGKRYEEADQEFEAAIRLDPRLWEAYYFRARGHYAHGNREQAVYWFQRAMEARPEDYQAPTLLASALAGLGRKVESDAAYRQALALAQRHLELDPGDTRALYFSAIALCQLGERREQSLEWAARALAMDPDEPQVLYNVACVYALQGQSEKAIDCLAATMAHGGWWRTWMKNDPDLTSLHGHPRFEALAAEP